LRSPCTWAGGAAHVLPPSATLAGETPAISLDAGPPAAAFHLQPEGLERDMPMQSNDGISCPSHVLCPTDFSPFSRRALAYAIALARPASAKLTVLHVSPLRLPSAGDDVLPEWMPEVPSSATQLLDELRQFAEPARAAGLPTELLIRDGDPGDEIVRTARSLGVDLIAMGSHGRRGLQRLLGSHAERVLRSAPCPVLTVSGPAGSDHADTVTVQIGRILCAASASTHSPATIEYAARLAGATGAQLRVVHVSDPGHRTRVALPASGDRLARGRLSLEERVTVGAPSSEILRSAKERPADLIVIGPSHRGSSSLGLLGSTSGQVVRGADCGVLTVREARSAEPEQPPAGQPVLATVGAGSGSGHGGPR